MTTETRLMFPNLTTAKQYNTVLLTMRNTLAHETLMVRNRFGQRVINPRRAALEAKMDATIQEGINRFGRLAFLPPSAFCKKCGKELRSKFGGNMSGPLYKGCEAYNPEIHCHRGTCQA